MKTHLFVPAQRSRPRYYYNIYSIILQCDCNSIYYSYTTKEYFSFIAVTAERFFRIDKAQENLHFPTDIGHENIYILDAAPLTPDTDTTAHPDTTASLDRSGPSVSLDTTTGLSVSLDISQSVDTPSAGVSLDVPESHARFVYFVFLELFVHCNSIIFIFH